MLSRLYAVTPAVRFGAAGMARYSRYLVRLLKLNVRGIHHWGGLDTFDPYVLH
jgi:hypothetical protein